MRSCMRYSSLAIPLVVSGILYGCFSREVDTVPAPSPVVETVPAPVVQLPPSVVVAAPPPVVQAAPVVVTTPASNQTTSTTRWDNGIVQQKQTTRLSDGTVEHRTTTNWNDGSVPSQTDLFRRSLHIVESCNGGVLG